jgi:Holliday junction resolvase RusA-like endonuclease
MVTFTIQGRLPSVNELIRWDRIVGRRDRPRRFFGAVKRRQAIYHCWAAIRSSPILKFKGPVDVSVKWVEPNRKRDYDNISSAIKFILDALVKTETIGGDSRKWIPDPVKHEYAVDKMNPRIEVTINEHKVVSGPELSRAA